MASLTNHPIIPKLSLGKLRDSELDDYTQQKIDKINEANGVTPPSGLMLFEDGEMMLFEDGEEMSFEG